MSKTDIFLPFQTMATSRTVVEPRYFNILNCTGSAILPPRLKGQSRNASHATPMIFGVGLSKTGTTSLAAALRILGRQGGD